MIVQMRTGAQATRVAAATGGVQLPGTLNRDGTPTWSARVDLGVDFEEHREAVEAISVLFTLYDTDPSGELVEVPSGWVLQAYRYALNPTPAQTAALESHAGGARLAFNTMLAAVKADLDQRNLICQTCKRFQCKREPDNANSWAGVDAQRQRRSGE